jgi:hypothetical protein
MRKRNTVLLVAAVLGMLLTTPARSDVLYNNNGATIGTISAWTISPNYSASDSFTLSGSSNSLTGAVIGLWVNPGDTPVSVGWSIGATPGSTTYASATLTNVNVSSSSNGLGGYYSIYQSTFSMNVTLGPGTYWLTLQDGTTKSGDPVYWDINNGQSHAWESYYGYANGVILPDLSSTGGGVSSHDSNSNWFQIQGTSSDPPSPVPLPGALLLFAPGLVGLAAVRRRFKK